MKPERRDANSNDSLYDSMIAHMQSLAPPGFVVQRRHMAAAMLIPLGIVLFLAFLALLLFMPVFKTDVVGEDPVSILNLREIPESDTVCPGGHYHVEGRCAVYPGAYTDHNAREKTKEKERSRIPPSSVPIMSSHVEHIAGSRVRSLSETSPIHGNRERVYGKGVREWTCEKWPEDAGARYLAIGMEGEEDRHGAAFRSIDKQMAARTYKRVAKRGATYNTMGIGYSVMKKCERSLLLNSPECTGVEAWKFIADIVCEPFPEDIWDVFNGLNAPGGDSAQAQREFEFGFAMGTMDANGITTLVDTRSQAYVYEGKRNIAIITWNVGHIVRQYGKTSEKVVSRYFSNVYDALKIIDEHSPLTVPLPSMTKYAFGDWMAFKVRELYDAAAPSMKNMNNLVTYEFMEHGMHNETFAWDELAGVGGMTEAVLAGFKAGWGRACSFEANFLEECGLGLPQISQMKHWMHNTAYFVALKNLLTSMSQGEMHQFIISCMMADLQQYTASVTAEKGLSLIIRMGMARDIAVSNSGSISHGVARDEAHDQWVVARHGLPTMRVTTEAEAIRKRHEPLVEARWTHVENCTEPDEFDTGLANPTYEDHRYVKSYHMHSVRLDWAEGHCRWLASQSLPPLNEELGARAAMVGAHPDDMDARGHGSTYHVHGFDARDRATTLGDVLGDLDWEAAMNPPAKRAFKDVSHAEQMMRLRRFNTALMHAEHHRHNRGDREEGEHTHGLYHTTDPGVRSKKRDPITRNAFFPAYFQHAAATATAYRHIIVAVHDGNATQATEATREFIDSLIASKDSPETIMYELEAVAALFCGTKPDNVAARAVYEVIRTYAAPGAEGEETSLWYRLHGN